MRNHFDPSSPTAETGLSRVVIGDVGCPEATGRRAEEVCSRDALLDLARSCGLAEVRPQRLADDITAAVRSSDPVRRAAATRTVTGFGRRTGALIATLRDPSTARRQGGGPACQAYLEHWLTVDRIWLAGGLLAGAGESVARVAAAWGAAAAQPCPVVLAPYPAATPLLGAARLACDTSPDDTAIAVADLGQTSVKTALVERSDTGVRRLRVTGSHPAQGDRTPETVLPSVAGALADVVRRAAEGLPGARVHLVVSIAAHLSGGVPVDDGASAYGCLHDRIASLRAQITAGSGAEVTMRFVHDATSAAAAGDANSATIMLGTWPGSGFRTAQAVPPTALADIAVHYG